MINFAAGFLAGALLTWFVIRMNQRSRDLWQINNENGDIEIKGRYMEKIPEIHRLLSEIASGSKSRYRKSAKTIMEYINNAGSNKTR